VLGPKGPVLRSPCDFVGPDRIPREFLRNGPGPRASSSVEAQKLMNHNSSHLQPSGTISISSTQEDYDSSHYHDIITVPPRQWGHTSTTSATSPESITPRASAGSS